MKWLLPLMVLCLALAVLKALLIALVIALLLVLAYAIATRPGETLALVVAVTVFTVASAQPVAFIITFGVVCVAVVAAGARSKSRSQHGLQPLLLPGDRRNERSPPTRKGAA